MADPAAGPAGDGGSVAAAGPVGPVGAAGDAGLADQVRLLFDAKAATWPAKYAPEGSLTGRLAQFAEGLADQVAAGGRVLDLGCGTGNLARAADAAGLRVTACDISPEMLRRATAGDRGGAVDWVSLEPRWARVPFESAAFHAGGGAQASPGRPESAWARSRPPPPRSGGWRGWRPPGRGARGSPRRAAAGPGWT